MLRPGRAETSMAGKGWKGYGGKADGWSVGWYLDDIMGNWKGSTEHAISTIVPWREQVSPPEQQQAQCSLVWWWKKKKHSSSSILCFYCDTNASLLRIYFSWFNWPTLSNSYEPGTRLDTKENTYSIRIDLQKILQGQSANNRKGKYLVYRLCTVYVHINEYYNNSSADFRRRESTQTDNQRCQTQNKRFSKVHCYLQQKLSPDFLLQPSCNKSLRLPL